MATLSGTAPKDTYKVLLQCPDTSNGIDGTLETLQDGEGTATCIKLATDTVAFQPPSSNSVTFLQIIDQGGTALLTADTTNDRIGIGMADPETTLDIRSTTTQLQLEYDDSNACTFAVSSGGDLTVVPSGGDMTLTGTLTVSGNVTMAENKKLYFDSTDTYIYADTTSAELLYIGADDDIILQPDDDLIVQAGTSEYVRFDGANTRVGIGVNDPDSKLEVLATSAQMKLSYDGSNAASFSVNASGDLAITPSGGDITTDGNHNFNEYLYHAGDTDTYIQFATDDITVGVGGEQFIKMTEDGSQDIITIGDAGDIDFKVSSGVANALFIQGSDGYVGIGTGAPSQLLHVTSSSSALPVVLIENTTADATGPTLQLHSQRNSTATDASDADVMGTISFTGYDDGTPSTQTYGSIIGSIVDSGSGSEEGKMAFKVAEVDGTLTEGMALIGHASTDSLVSLSIGGYATPSDMVHVQDGDVSIVTNNVTNGTANYLKFYKSGNATDGSHTVVADDELLGGLTFYGSDGDSFALAAGMKAVVNGTPGDGDMPGSLEFWTSADGAEAETTRLTIGASGLASFTGAVTVTGVLTASSTVTLSDDVTIAEGKKIIFDSSDTYIYANTDANEDLVIGADDAIILEPDGDVSITPGGEVTIADGKLSLTDTDVAHGITDVATTSTYGNFGPIHATYGGLYIQGLSDQESAAARSLALRGISNDTHTDTVPNVEIIGAKRSGTTVQALASAETVLQVANHTTELMTVLGGGNVGIGVVDPDYTLEVFNAGTQLKLSYDADSFITMAVDNSSNLTIATGESGTIAFSDAISVTAGNATLTDGNLVITAADHGIIHTNSGTVTQGTNATTGVTINTTSGVITTYAATLATNTEVQFAVTNSTVQADSVVICTMQDQNTDANSHLLATTNTVAGGSFNINLFNCGSGTASATACKIHFLVINNS